MNRDLSTQGQHYSEGEQQLDESKGRLGGTEEFGNGRGWKRNQPLSLPNEIGQELTACCHYCRRVFLGDPPDSPPHDVRRSDDSNRGAIKSL